MSICDSQTLSVPFDILHTTIIIQHGNFHCTKFGRELLWRRLRFGGLREGNIKCHEHGLANLLESRTRNQKKSCSTDGHGLSIYNMTLNIPFKTHKIATIFCSMMQRVTSTSSVVQWQNVRSSLLPLEAEARETKV